MAERTILLILSGVVLISLAACQPAALSSATETNPPTDTAQPSPSPTQTATPEPSPTSTLQPAVFEAGLEGVWTPVLVPRTGYCDYSCHACGLV